MLKSSQNTLAETNKKYIWNLKNENLLFLGGLYLKNMLDVENGFYLILSSVIIRDIYNLSEKL